MKKSSLTKYRFKDSILVKENGLLSVLVLNIEDDQLYQLDGPVSKMALVLYNFGANGRKGLTIAQLEEKLVKRTKGLTKTNLRGVVDALAYLGEARLLERDDDSR